MAGMTKACPHLLQRTFLPRAESGTLRTARHFRLVQTIVTLTQTPTPTGPNELSLLLSARRVNGLT